MKHCRAVDNVGNFRFPATVYCGFASNSSAKRFCLTKKNQLSTFLVRGTIAMSPIAAEMMRSNLSPEEASVSAIIAQYLIENSQIFKELTEIRAEVFQNKIRH